MINPYKDVNWDGCQRVVSSSHYHCQSRQQVIKAYEQQGMRHFAFSNYHKARPYYLNTDFPEVTDQTVNDKFAEIVNQLGTSVFESPNAEHSHMTDEGCGSLHLNGLGSTWESGYHASGEDENGETIYKDDDGNIVENAKPGVNNTWQYAVDNILANLKYPSGGGVTINHPNYPYSDYYGYSKTIAVDIIKNILDYNPLVLGLEIFNGSVAKGLHPTTGWALEKWDEVLKTGRRAWGFCTPDWDNKLIELRHGRSILLIDGEPTEQKCLEAYRNGNFYGQIGKRGANSTATHQTIDCDLRFKSINFDKTTRELSVDTDGTASWINIIYGVRGVVYRKKIEGTCCSFTVPANATYVRVEACEEGVNRHTGTTGTSDKDTENTVYTYVDDPVYYGDCSDVIFSNPIMFGKKKRQNVLMWF